MYARSWEAYWQNGASSTAAHVATLAFGAAAVVAMGLGTAVFTLIVATLAVAGRDAAFLAAGDGRAARLLGPGLQIAVGGLILGIGGTLALAALPL